MIAEAEGAAVQAGVFDVVGRLALLDRVVLHGGHPHAAESSNVVPLAYVVLGVVLVGLVGGLLFWYYERRAESA